VKDQMGRHSAPPMCGTAFLAKPATDRRVGHSGPSRVRGWAAVSSDGLLLSPHGKFVRGSECLIRKWS
jgi:hypothetical protein